MKSVVRQEDDDGVVLVGAFRQGIEHPTVLRIHIGRRGEVGLHRGLVQAGIEHRLRELPLSSDHEITEGRNVIKVIGVQERRLHFLQGKQVEVFLRNKPGHVWIEGSVDQEEGLLVLLLEDGDGLVRPAGIVHLFFGEMNRPPVLLPLADGLHRSAGRARVTLVSYLVDPDIVPIPSVGDLPIAIHRVARLRKGLEEGYGLLQRLTGRDIGLVVIDPGLVGADAGPHRSARGHTERRSRVGVSKDHTAFTQFLEIGGHDVPGVSLRLFQDPGVEVVGDEHQDVHAFLGVDRPDDQSEKEEEADFQEMVEPEVLTHDQGVVHMETASCLIRNGGGLLGIPQGSHREVTAETHPKVGPGLRGGGKVTA